MDRSAGGKFTEGKREPLAREPSRAQRSGARSSSRPASRCTPQALDVTSRKSAASPIDRVRSTHPKHLPPFDVTGSLREPHPGTELPPVAVNGHRRRGAGATRRSRCVAQRSTEPMAKACFVLAGRLRGDLPRVPNTPTGSNPAVLLDYERSWNSSLAGGVGAADLIRSGRPRRRLPTSTPLRSRSGVSSRRRVTGSGKTEQSAAAAPESASATPQGEQRGMATQRAGGAA